MSHIFHYFKHLPKTTYLISQVGTPLISCIHSNSCIYHPEAPPKALIPPKFAGAGPSSNPGVAAPTKGVVSC